MGSLTLRTATKRLLLTAVVAASTLVPQASHALEVSGDGWCYIVGEVQGLDSELMCPYTAKGPTQTVYIATPYTWNVFIVEDIGNGYPEEVILAEGVGTSQGATTRIHTAVGEMVFVRMYAAPQRPVRDHRVHRCGARVRRYP
jgi:hypothetical protein